MCHFGGALVHELPELLKPPCPEPSESLVTPAVRLGGQRQAEPEDSRLFLWRIAEAFPCIVARCHSTARVVPVQVPCLDTRGVTGRPRPVMCSPVNLRRNLATLGILDGDIIAGIMRSVFGGDSEPVAEDEAL
jgi:hypothetical protein